ncbi:MAG: TadE/TadG family type IV pilus assembly protein [Acidobacteriota bacterium]
MTDVLHSNHSHHHQNPDMGRVRTALESQRGQSMVELAIALPFLLLLVAGIIEFGRAYYQYNTLSKSVREAARYMTTKAWLATERTNATNLVVYGNVTGSGSPVLPGLTTSNVQITPRGGGTSDTNPPDWVQVAITNYQFRSRIPLVPINVTFTPGVEMRYVGLNARY